MLFFSPLVRALKFLSAMAPLVMGKGLQLDGSTSKGLQKKG